MKRPLAIKRPIGPFALEYTSLSVTNTGLVTMEEKRKTKKAVDWCMSKAESGVSTGKKQSRKTTKGIVYFITSAEVIQATLTGLSVAVITVGVENLSLTITYFVDVPQQPVIFLLILLATRFVWWIRNNTEEWRNFVEKTTGEETADDEPDTETAVEDDNN